MHFYPLNVDALTLISLKGIRMQTKCMIFSKKIKNKIYFYSKKNKTTSFNEFY